MQLYSIQLLPARPALDDESVDGAGLVVEVPTPRWSLGLGGRCRYPLPCQRNWWVENRGTKGGRKGKGEGGRRE